MNLVGVQCEKGASEEDERSESRMVQMMQEMLQGKDEGSEDLSAPFLYYHQMSTGLS